MERINEDEGYRVWLEREGTEKRFLFSLPRPDFILNRIRITYVARGTKDRDR